VLLAAQFRSPFLGTPTSYEKQITFRAFVADENAPAAAMI
jgi:hypothetical protein